MIQTRSLFTTFRYCPKDRIATEHNILDGRLCCVLCGRSVNTAPLMSRLTRFFRCWR